jgi:hypothetical protein
VPNYAKGIRYLRPDYGTVTISGDLANGFVGEVVNVQAYTMTGGYGTKTAALASGSLPSGLTLNADGSVTGTRTTEQTSTWSVVAIDADGVSSEPLADTSQTFIPPSLVGSAPDGTYAVAYSYSYTISGGLAPFTVEVIAGALPTGMSISDAAELSGTPSQILAASPTYRITDARGSYTDLTDPFSIAYGMAFDSTPSECFIDGDGTAEFQDSDYAIYAAHSGVDPTEIRAHSIVEITGLRYFEFDLAMNNNSTAGRFYVGVHGLENDWPNSPDDYVYLRAQNSDGSGDVQANIFGTPLNTDPLNWSLTDHGTCRVRVAVKASTRTVWIGVGASGAWVDGDPETDTGGWVVNGPGALHVAGDLRNSVSGKQRRIEVVMPDDWTWTPPSGFI